MTRGYGVRGDILSFDLGSGSGLISGDDGVRYRFTGASLQPGSSARPGQRVDFVADGDAATQIMILSPSTKPPIDGPHDAPYGMAQPFQFQTALFSFNGRLRRQNFWIGWLILLGVGVVLGWIPLLGTLISIGLIWPNLAITVKRLHDMGHSGWLAAIPYGVGIVGTIVGISIIGVSAIANSAALEREDPMAVLGIVGPVFGLIALLTLVGLGFLIWIGVVDSQPGTNRFGPNPKAPVDAEVFR